MLIKGSEYEKGISSFEVDAAYMGNTNSDFQDIKSKMQ